MKHQLLFLFLFFFSACSSAQTATLETKEIIKADNITIPVYDFKGISALFNQENDTTYVINFWATWCVPCVAELPYFEQLLITYAHEKVRIILVSLDFRNKVEQSLIPFLKKKNLIADVCLLDDKDANYWINAIDPSWSGALPATIIYKNKERAFFEKSFTFESLETEYNNIKNK
jgi:thiol-disulfide isomerase/thioredoxin